jgi:hypothetical protein
MTATTTSKIPAPLYAVAGVGELAYRQLRRLPTRVERLPVIVAELRSEIPTAMSSFVAQAQGVYHGLVARGERTVAAVRHDVMTSPAPRREPAATSSAATKPASTPTRRAMTEPVASRDSAANSTPRRPVKATNGARRPRRGIAE